MGPIARGFAGARTGGGSRPWSGNPIACSARALRLLRPLAVAFAIALGLPLIASADPVPAAEAARAEAAFESFIARHGGAEVIGGSLGPSLPSGQPGGYYRYHSNFKLEYWPQLAGTPYEVQPALLGAMAAGPRWYPKAAPFRNGDNARFFPQTGHSIRYGFLEFFRATGGIELLGYPLTEELPDGSSTIQYFQRGVLRFNPAAKPTVQALPLGELFAARAASPWHARITTGPVPELVSPGGSLRLEVALENAGSAVWRAAGESAFSLSLHWKTELNVPGAYDGPRFPLPRDVPPGEKITMQIDLPAPPRPGAFTIIWDPQLAGRWMSSMGTVTGQAQLAVGTDIPSVRVGILELGDENKKDRQATISATGGFTVETASGTVLATIEAGVRVAATYEDGAYTLRSFGREPIVTGEPVIFRTAPSGLMIVDEIQPGNTYRGTFEFRHSPDLKSTWLINSLALEDYLAGLTEQGEEAPWEALKASVIAFRTYSLAVQARMRAKNLEPFDLAASTERTPTYFTRHQFYVGYRRELEGDRLRQALRETRGMVMTYGGRVIEAVYFSQANGRTYSWERVWGQPGRPWAMGVDDPVSAGSRQIGHGVGMPLRSANALAVQGYVSEQILQTYYSGIEFAYAY